MPRGHQSAHTVIKLSDKYDRDRRALSSVQQPRGKERDMPSQLGTTSSRIPSQSQQGLGNRQLDSREHPRKKDGETSEDWRRGMSSTLTQSLSY
jgi:hypothetical protein